MTRRAEHRDAATKPHVVIVGGGFAGVGCAHLLSDAHVPVTLLDRNNYHQFQPLLYQLATAQLAADDVATPLRTLFRKQQDVTVKEAEVAEVDVADADGDAPPTGVTFSGDYLVLAMGSQPNFFRTPGAAEHTLPLYSLLDAERLRSRILEVFDAADRDPRLIDEGALSFVIVGGGATGVEIAGALADFINHVLPPRVPRPGGPRDADPPRRSRQRAAGAVLGERARVRGEGAPTQRRPAEDGYRASRRSRAGSVRLGRRDRPAPPAAWSGRAA